MRLVASLICHDEMGRYLPLVIADLQTYCDEIRVVDDASTDGSFEWLIEQDRVQVTQFAESEFFRHEGRARDALLRWSFGAKGTHYLSIDCDEVCGNGAALRAHLEAEPDVPVWSLEIAEVWNARPAALDVRIDGGWRPHQLACLWKAPLPGETFTMLNKKLACRRVPTQVLAQKAKPSNQTLLHLGWANQRERQQRYDRYAKHDGGRFHAGSHLRSILWEDRRVKLEQRPWPEGEVFSRLRERFMIPA